MVHNYDSKQMVTFSSKGYSVKSLFCIGELPLAAERFILDLRTTHFDGAIMDTDSFW